MSNESLWATLRKMFQKHESESEQLKQRIAKLEEDMDRFVQITRDVNTSLEALSKSVMLLSEALDIVHAKQQERELLQELAYMKPGEFYDA